MAAFAAIFTVTFAACGGGDEPNPDPVDPEVLDISTGEDTPTGIHFNGLYYLLDVSTATVIKADEDVTAVKVPMKVKRSGSVYTVNTIAKEAFRDCKSLASISMSSSVEEIGESAFYGCTNLSQISLTSSIEEIGEMAFSGCKSLTQITIPARVKEIKKNCFSNSGLKSVELPAGLNKIGDYAFNGCPLNEQTSLSSGITEIGNYAFYGCSLVNLKGLPSSLKKIGSANWLFMTANLPNCPSRLH